MLNQNPPDLSVGSVNNVPYPFHPDLVIALYVKAFDGDAARRIMQQFDGQVMTSPVFDQLEQTLGQWFQTCWYETFSSKPLGTFRPSISPTPEQLQNGEISVIVPGWFKDLLEEAQEYNKRAKD